MDALFKFMSQYIELTDEDKALIREANIIKSFAKGAKIKRFDQDSDETFFVLTGLVYTEFHVQDKTVVGDFFAEGQPVVVPKNSAGKDAPYELTSIEDASLMAGTEQAADEFIEKFPKFQKVCFPYAQSLLSNSLAQNLRAKAQSPSDRYQEFLRARPELAGRVPQYLLANYLGITAESLSRVRKRLALDDRQ